MAKKKAAKAPAKRAAKPAKAAKKRAGHPPGSVGAALPQKAKGGAREDAGRKKTGGCKKSFWVYPEELVLLAKIGGTAGQGFRKIVDWIAANKAIVSELGKK